MYMCSSTQQICLTCEHWLGYRVLRPNRAEVETESMGERGRCRIQSVISTMGEGATCSCPNWRKWGGFSY